MGKDDRVPVARFSRLPVLEDLFLSDLSSTSLFEEMPRCQAVVRIVAKLLSFTAFRLREH